MRLPAIPFVLAFALVAPGCFGDAAVPAPPPEAGPPDSGARKEPGAKVTLARAFNGTIVYRLAGDGGPSSASERDPYAFCVLVPTNTTRLHAVLEWSPAEPMTLEFVWGPGPDERATTIDGSPTRGVADVRGPLELTLEHPEPGRYQVYAGPPAAGSSIEWALKLTWDVARAEATLEETIDTSGEACN